VFFEKGREERGEKRDPGEKGRGKGRKKEKKGGGSNPRHRPHQYLIILIVCCLYGCKKNKKKKGREGKRKIRGGKREPL